MKGFFVTGTDTEIGKTTLSAGIVYALAARGLRVAAMKPVASGGVETAGGLRSEDALHLIGAMNVEAEYALVNPYCFAPPIAPHVAARETGVEVDADVLKEAAAALAADADVLVVEGVGGWRVPLSATFDVPALARLLDLPVILVVGLRLGCLNHAQLSAESIVAHGCRLAGWAGSCPVPAEMDRMAENVATLKRVLPVPCLGVVPHTEPPAPGAVAAALDAAGLLRALERQE